MSIDTRTQAAPHGDKEPQIQTTYLMRERASYHEQAEEDDDKLYYLIDSLALVQQDGPRNVRQVVDQIQALAASSDKETSPHFCPESWFETICDYILETAIAFESRDIRQRQLCDLLIAFKSAAGNEFAVGSSTPGEIQSDIDAVSRSAYELWRIFAVAWRTPEPSKDGFWLHVNLHGFIAKLADAGLLLENDLDQILELEVKDNMNPDVGKTGSRPHAFIASLIQYILYAKQFFIAEFEKSLKRINGRVTTKQQWQTWVDQLTDIVDSNDELEDWLIKSEVREARDQMVILLKEDAKVEEDATIQ